MNIWVLEDDGGMQFIYSLLLGQQNQLKIFSNIKSFLMALKESTHSILADLVIADLRLPDGCFLEALAWPEFQNVPPFSFLVVSGIDDRDTLRACFEEGAVDYLTKPFSENELLVKIERYLSPRTIPSLYSTTATLAFSPLANLFIDPLQMICGSKENSSVTLTPRELQIMNVLYFAGERAIQREEILHKVWGEIKVGHKTLDVHLFNLRKKLRSIGFDIEFIGPGSYILSAKK